MRSIIIAINCDACEAEIEEDVEGASSVLFTVRGEKRELDLCDECLGGTFLQEARLLRGKRKAKQPKKSKDGMFHGCDDCGKIFETQRGLSQHKAKMHA